MRLWSLRVLRVSCLGILAAALLRPLGRWSSLAELTTNFAPQLLLVAVPLGGMLSVLGSRRDLFLGFAPFMLLAPVVVPLLVGSPPQIDRSAAPLRVLQYNVWFQNTSHDSILAEIEAADADVVALHELTATQWTALEPSLRATFPYTITAPVELPGPHGNGGGKALLSRTPLQEVQVEAEFPLPPLAATTSIAGETVLLIALHPSPSRTGDWLIAQRKDKLRSTVAAIAAHEGPAVIITDLNMTPTSSDYLGLLRELDWDDPRRGLGIAPTYPADGFYGLGLAIDHVLTSPEFAVHDYELGDGGGSDHRSLVATLSLAP